MSEVRIDFMGRVSPIEKVYSKSVRNIGTRSTVLPQGKKPEGSWGMAELEES